MSVQLTVDVNKFIKTIEEYNVPTELSSIILLTYVLYVIELIDTKQESTFLSASYKEIINKTMDTDKYAKALHALYTDERIVPAMYKNVTKCMVDREDVILKGSLSDWLITPDNCMIITFSPNVDV